MTSPELFIQEDKIIAVSPEGRTASMPLAMLMERLAAPTMDTGPLLLGGPIKAVRSRGPVTIMVLEKAPALHRLRWIAPGSRNRYGPGTTYRDVTLALPYLVVMAVFSTRDTGRFTLSGANECFFRNAPIKSFKDELSFPALLNCSKFRVNEGHPLSWICTQYLRRDLFDHEADLNARVRAGLQELFHCLLETGFNYSSEAHEGSSWFTESRKVDPRVATVEAWQEASLKNSDWITEVPWLKTGLSLDQVIDRIFKNQGVNGTVPTSKADLTRIVFNYRPAQP